LQGSTKVGPILSKPIYQTFDKAQQSYQTRNDGALQLNRLRSGNPCTE